MAEAAPLRVVLQAKRATASAISSSVSGSVDGAARSTALQRVDERRRLLRDVVALRAVRLRERDEHLLERGRPCRGSGG